MRPVVEPVSMRSGMTAPPPCYELRDLCVRYRGKPALRDVTLNIPARRLTAIVGPSGCGKSTLLHCLNRMTDLVPDCDVRGQLRLFSEDLLAPGVDRISLRRRVGLIFQKPNPFPLSIVENLTFALRHHGMRRRVDRNEAARLALGRVGLWDEVKDRLREPAHTLSGGQQQRLCLARALVLNPQVLLLDEPCSALDPLATECIEDLIRQLRGLTIVLVTHNIAQARRLADHLAVFWRRDDAGALIEAGPADRLFDRPAESLTASYLRGERG